LVVDERSRRNLLGAPVVKCGRGPDLARNPKPLEDRAHITVGAKVIRVDHRRHLRVPRCEPDRAPAVRLQRADTEQVGVGRIQPDDSGGVGEHDL
jgi:hypothetical protein